MYVCMYVGGSDEFLRGYQVKPLTSTSVLDEQVRVLIRLFFFMYGVYMYVCMLGCLGVLWKCVEGRVHASAPPHIDCER